MNRRIKNLWIKALESGKYKQGKNRLRTDDKFCCLGVLCDIYRKETGKGEWRGNIKKVFAPDKESDDSTEGELPCIVSDWAKLESENPRIEFGGDIASISNLNDGRRQDKIPVHSFKEIAKVIKKQL